MKSYTDFEQSKKLAKILSSESADMCYGIDDDTLTFEELPWLTPYHTYTYKEHYIPCWSFAALLEVIRNAGRYELQMYEGGYYFEANGFMTESYFNPIDACYEMILKLNEQKLL